MAAYNKTVVVQLWSPTNTPSNIPSCIPSNIRSRAAPQNIPRSTPSILPPNIPSGGPFTYVSAKFTAFGEASFTDEHSELEGFMTYQGTQVWLLFLCCCPRVVCLSAAFYRSNIPSNIPSSSRRSARPSFTSHLSFIRPLPSLSYPTVPMAARRTLTARSCCHLRTGPSHPFVSPYPVHAALIMEPWLRRLLSRRRPADQPTQMDYSQCVAITNML